MIPAEQVAHIRHLFHAEHWKVGTIAAELGLHPDTVRAALESHRFRSTPPSARQSDGPLPRLPASHPRALPPPAGHSPVGHDPPAR
jgi:hypothetical protein